MWSQLQMLTVAPANGSLAAVPPTVVACLDEQRAQAGPGEVGGADQAVVAGADDDRVVVVRRRVARHSGVALMCSVAVCSLCERRH